MSAVGGVLLALGCAAFLLLVLGAPGRRSCPATILVGPHARVGHQLAAAAATSRASLEMAFEAPLYDARRPAEEASA